MICSLCPRRCKAVRDDVHGEGYCRMPSLPRVARAALHYGEEPCISGTKGSGTVFFSGCSLSCIFCQNYAISQQDFGKTISVDELADIFRSLVAQGAHNINLVNPTHFLPVIRQALRQYRPPVPVLYNSSGYERADSLRGLEGLIDIYLPDFKYADDTLAAAFSDAPHYASTALKAIAEMRRQTGDIRLDSTGLAVSGTMVRHLVLPGHTRNSIEALQLLKDTFADNLWVSLLFQYTPVLPLPQKELNRHLTTRECEKVFNRLCELKLTNGYVQDLKSTGTTFIPAFDLTGIPQE